MLAGCWTPQEAEGLSLMGVPWEAGMEELPLNGQGSLLALAGSWSQKGSIGSREWSLSLAVGV